MKNRVRTATTAALTAVLLLLPAASAFADGEPSPQSDLASSATDAPTVDPAVAVEPTADPPDATPVPPADATKNLPSETSNVPGDAGAAASAAPADSDHRPTTTKPEPPAPKSAGTTPADGDGPRSQLSTPSTAAEPKAAVKSTRSALLGAPVPTPIVLTWGSVSLNGYAGLNYTSSLSVKNTGTTAMTDVYVTFTQQDSRVAWRLPAPSDDAMVGYSFYATYGNPSCAQSATGAPIVCGPYAIAPGATQTIKNNPWIPQDYLIRYGQVPLGFTAAVTAASVGGSPIDLATSPVAPVSKSVTVLTSAYPGVDMTKSLTSTSPGLTTLTLATANQDWSMAQRQTATMKLPAGVVPVPGTLPAGCADDGSTAGDTVTCVVDNLPLGTQKNWSIQIQVPEGIAVGTVIPRAAPSTIQTSTLEPAGASRTSWTGTGGSAPYTLTIVGPVDIAATIGAPSGTVAGGATVSFPVTITNAAGSPTAKKVTGSIDLSGLAVTDVAIDVPGCTVVENTSITCSLGAMSGGSSVSGNLTVTFPDAGAVDQTLRVGGAFEPYGQADSDPTNNTFARDALLPHAPRSTVHVEYQDGEGNTVAVATDSTSQPGSAYAVRAKDIAGLHVVGPGPGNAAGTYPADGTTITVVFVYAPDVAYLHVTYVDDDGNGIADSRDLSATPGTHYELTGPTIAGYHATVPPENATGEYGADGTTTDVVFLYARDPAEPTSPPTIAPTTPTPTHTKPKPTPTPTRATPSTPTPEPTKPAIVVANPSVGPTAPPATVSTQPDSRPTDVKLGTAVTGGDIWPAALVALASLGAGSIGLLLRRSIGHRER